MCFPQPLLFLVCNILLSLMGSVMAENCPDRQDVVIVLDGSNSINNEVYIEGMYFAAKLGSYFSGESRFAFMTYSDVVRKHFGLDTKSGIYPDISALVGQSGDGAYQREMAQLTRLAPEEVHPLITAEKAVDGGYTNTGLAIKKATKELQQNARVGVPQKIVVLTDGLTTMPLESSLEHIIEAAEETKQKNIAVFSIGIGRHWQSAENQKELLAIAQNVTKNRFYVRDDFELILNCIRGYSIQNGHGSDCKMSNVDIPKSCSKKNDLVIVLDSSGSVSYLDYQKATRFVARLAMAFIPPNRVSFFTYSTKVQKRFGLDEHLTLEDVLDKINTHSRVIGHTNTGGAIKMAMNEMLTHRRAGIPQKIVVLTDGASTLPTKQTGPQVTAEAAANASKTGILMFSVGFGDLVKSVELQKELLAIAGGEDKNRFTAESIEQHLQRIREVTKAICNAGDSPSIPTEP